MRSDSTTKISRLPFSSFSFSRLFQDYTAYSSEIAPFFAGDFRQTASFEQAASRTLNVPRDRDTLADVLLEQNKRWGLQDQTRANIEKLRNPESVVVITGQQLGLFLSPLYIPYKTLTTLLLADHLEQALNRPVVPVFWLAGEDHDFEEVTSFMLPGAEKPEQFLYDPPRNGRGPVGRIALTNEIVDLLDRAETILPPSPNKAALIDFFRATYKPGTSFRDAFAKTINRLFSDTGLIIASVDDPKLKNLCVPLFQQEINDFATVTSVLETTTRSLEERYHAQVRVSPTNLFLMDDDSRYPIDAREAIFRPRGNGQSFDADTLNALIATQPGRFSPNVVLRPIVQDVLFPTISYVAGPGEIAYYAQYKEAYAWANLPMPIIFPRASITLIEPAIRRILSNFDIDFTAFKEDPDKFFRAYSIAHLDLDVEQLFAAATSQVESGIDALQKAVTDWEASLQKTAGSTRQTIRKELDRFKEQIIKAQKRRMMHQRKRINRIHTHLFPGGKLQERSISPMYYLNQYGFDFFKSLMRDVSLDTTSHQVIDL